MIVARFSLIQEKFDRTWGGTDNLPVARHFVLRSIDLIEIASHTATTTHSIRPLTGCNMATLQIDKMLETVCRENASDLHVATGQPPVLRLGGHLVRLETKSLTPEDTVGLMKSITPERNQQELQEVGGTD